MPPRARTSRAGIAVAVRFGLVVAALVIFAQSSAIAPFIYTLF